MPAIIRKAAQKVQSLMRDRKSRKAREESREEQKRMIDFAHG